MMAFLMGLKTISPAELHRLVQQRAVTVFDVNSAQSWASAHVPGAKHLDPAGYQAAELPADKAALLVFYCSNPLCRKTPNAAKRAQGMGYGDVRVLSAGITGWTGENLPTESA